MRKSQRKLQAETKPIDDPNFLYQGESIMKTTTLSLAPQVFNHAGCEKPNTIATNTSSDMSHLVKHLLDNPGYTVQLLQAFLLKNQSEHFMSEEHLQLIKEVYLATKEELLAKEQLIECLHCV